MAGIDQDLRQRFERRKSALKLELNSFIPHYKELSQFILPRRGRFFIEDRNRGGERYNSIINSKATTAHRVARSGLLAGTMSPARPWFSFETPDPDMMQNADVKQWLYKAELILRSIFNASNFYQSSSTMLGELILFATGAMVHVDDFEDVARFYPLTAGSYMIGQDDRQVVNTLCREYEMTVLQVMGKFKKEGGTVSRFVQDSYDNGNYDAWVPITHIIEPNEEYDGGKLLAKYKKFRSCYYEPGNTERNAVLSDSGFDSFPAYAPRWDVTGEDIYGTDCPAMTALGDIKGLQIEERRKGQAIDKMVNPPLKGPASMRSVPVDSLPGGLTIYDGDAGKDSLSPLYSVNPQLQEMRLDMKAVEERIDVAFYNHLFRAISDMEGVQPRNQLELQQRDNERLLELGPVLEHIHGEFLAKVVERTFAQCVKANIFPPAPPVLQGKVLNTKFVSTLAMAQRSVSAGIIERSTTYVTGLISAGFQTAAMKFNANAAIEEYAAVTGLSPRLINSDADVAAQQQAQAQQQQQAQKLAAVNSLADSASKAGQGVAALGNTPGAASGGTALQNLATAVQQRGSQNLFQSGIPRLPGNK